MVKQTEKIGPTEMAPEDNPMDDDPHGECAFEIHRLQARVTELEAAARNSCTAPEGSYCFIRDGSMWRCTEPGFVNLQESVAGFGATFDEAYADFKKGCQQRADEYVEQYIAGRNQQSGATP